MYKVTVNGQTRIGCNEDAWRTTSHIWFKNARFNSPYGAAFTGSRQVGENTFAPQSGMNEVGLTFSRLVAFHPLQKDAVLPHLKITNEVTYLTSILQQCATIDEVKAFISKYDHSIFIDDVFIYTDRNGNYLIVEPYKLIDGNDPNYVLANFCPSITTDEMARNQERYKNGKDYLKTHPIRVDLESLSALSDTMHVCRSRNGDGTLLTSLWNPDKGLVNLYFYHNYDSSVQFDISEMLAKGDTLISISSLFPVNEEFERLANYKTPFNTPSIRITLALLGALLPILTLYFAFVFIKNKEAKLRKVLLTMGVLNLLLAGFFFILATTIGIFYFDAPFVYFGSPIKTAMSYFPFVLALAAVPVIQYSIYFMNQNTYGINAIKIVIPLNIIIYLLALFSFAYWGLFVIW